MATAAKSIEYPHIVKVPDLRAGKACIEGTRIAVVDIVRLHKQGYRPEEMLDRFARPALALAQVYAALLYYEDNHQEIEDYFQRADETRETYEVFRAEYLKQKPTT